MILKALYDYYDRMSADGILAEEGKEYKEIPYEIVIDRDGNFIRFENTVEVVNNKKIGRKYLVKKETIGTSNASKTTYSFWGKPIYILKNDTEHNKTFISKVDEYVNMFPENQSFRAVKVFYNNFEDNIELAKKDELYDEILKKNGCQIIFRIVGEFKAVAEHEDIFKTKREEDLSQVKEHTCLITGRKEKEFIRISSKISMLRESKALMVSFNNRCYESYNKTQCENAPISVLADFKYTTALNYLLQKDSTNNFCIEEQMVIFWSKKSSTFEKQFSLFFEDNNDDPNAYVQLVKDMYHGIFSGIETLDTDNEFYLLGLCLNKTRIVISCFKEGAIKDFATNILQHYEDIKLVGNRDVPPNIYELLKSLTIDNKIDSLPPGLFTKVLMSIINNRPYPQQIELLCVMRIRVAYQKKDFTLEEKKVYRNIMANRMSLLKAYINRNERINKTNNYITMSLDLENNNSAYLCGRLFAVIEKCQQEAMPGLKATIKDKYYTAASTTPSIVFGRLLQMTNVYLSKISDVNMSELIGEITERLSADGFPKNLNFDNQSRFALGYYHQSNVFFKKSTDK